MQRYDIQWDMQMFFEKKFELLRIKSNQITAILKAGCKYNEEWINHQDICELSTFYSKAF